MAGTAGEEAAGRPGLRNNSAHHGLRIVATGSSRPKLALLRASKDQAFYKAAMQTFPPLGCDDVEGFIANTGLSNPLDVRRTEAVFARAGSRPEVLVQALGELDDLVGSPGTAGAIDDQFGEAATA
jgi:hypothetical protein